MQNYKNLEIYQISHKLTVEVHRMTLENLPKFEMYEKEAKLEGHLNLSLPQL